MIRLVWNLSIPIHALLRYAPTNMLLAAVRTPRGLKWGLAVMLLAPAYWFAAAVCYTLQDQGGPDWLAFLGLLFIWNGLKVAWAGPGSLVMLARNASRRRGRARGTQQAQEPGHPGLTS